MRPVEVLISVALLLQVAPFLRAPQNGVGPKRPPIHASDQGPAAASLGAIRLSVQRPAFLNSVAIIEQDFNFAASPTA